MQVLNDENVERAPKMARRGPRRVLGDVTGLEANRNRVRTAKDKLGKEVYKEASKERSTWTETTREEADEDEQSQKRLEYQRARREAEASQFMDDTVAGREMGAEALALAEAEAEAEAEDEAEDDETEVAELEPSVVPLSPKWDNSIEEELESVIYKYYRQEPDPEDEDTWDVSMVAEYAPEIFNHMRDLEPKYAPYPYYIPQVQSEITWDNRSTLVNWLVQVHSRFNLLPETLFLSVNIIDRFLSKRPISLSKFQLCGAVALFIAAKYEEINCPTVKQMAYMVSNQYTPEELLKAEKFMITELGFSFGYPGPMSFLRRASKADNYDSEIRTLAKYFLEVTIMEPRLVAAPPSWLAAGASYLSIKMLHQGDWTPEHVYYSGYTEEQLAPLAELLVECCINCKTHHKAIYDKYCERRFKRSALFVRDYLKR